MPHKYTDEQYKFIKDNAEGVGNAELTEMFNKHFQLNLTVEQIKGFKKNKKISSGLTGHFKKGNIPMNKLVKGLCKPNRTSFKKGQRPHNYMPVGSERINTMGYIDIKIDENTWKAKHLIIWEEHNGPVPEGHAVLFADRNHMNLDIDNLILVTKKQLSILAGRKLIYDDPELTKTGIVLATLYEKINERKK